jgi:hypothetical protein
MRAAVRFGWGACRQFWLNNIQRGLPHGNPMQLPIVEFQVVLLPNSER